MTKALQLAQSNLFNLADEAVEQMKIVEGDIKLADLQGFCAGVEQVKELLLGAGYRIISNSERLYDMPLDRMDIIELISLENEIDEPDDRWVLFCENRKQLETEKKEFLYSEECTKGRDLAFIHAWKRAVNYIDRFYLAIQNMAEKERVKGPLLFQ